ncbi:hypothetical protein [Stakelama pacifica]|uniref:Uncharacterized protein n=1 Tax=Stakelama pacifica TaxID=517720 RepID=A0A4R6FY36_9SPHN|nr:hypothetical protein [Stakelama pacifica]MAW99166.1 hypothetical protein [Sphingomonas sp.]TDN86727.1 hypothetical protein EV664_101303 [Stakelama pacifica]GGO90494.1 hypothetical protein GCM10011329_02960 [Stakelama pacifica]
MIVQILLFFYGLIAMFVLMSIERNRKEKRANSDYLTLAGWGVMSMSASLALSLLGAAALLLVGIPATAA